MTFLIMITGACSFINTKNQTRKITSIKRSPSSLFQRLCSKTLNIGISKGKGKGKYKSIKLSLNEYEVFLNFLDSQRMEKFIEEWENHSINLNRVKNRSEILRTFYKKKNSVLNKLQSNTKLSDNDREMLVNLRFMISSNKFVYHSEFDKLPSFSGPITTEHYLELLSYLKSDNGRRVLKNLNGDIDQFREISEKVDLYKNYLVNIVLINLKQNYKDLDVHTWVLNMIDILPEILTHSPDNQKIISKMLESPTINDFRNFITLIESGPFEKWKTSWLESVRAAQAKIRNAKLYEQSHYLRDEILQTLSKNKPLTLEETKWLRGMASMIPFNLYANDEIAQILKRLR